MTTAIAAPVLEAKPATAPNALQAEARVLLNGITWEAYEQISNALVDYHSARLNYYDGMLEIMTISYPHERYKKILGQMVETLASEMEIDCIGSGQTTFKKERLTGFEGDETFYFSYLDELRRPGKEIDLADDPAPDLVVEVDISNPSLAKFPIFSALGIAEVWRWHDNELTIYHRVGKEYEPRQSSHFLPNVTATKINELIYENQTMPSFAWNKLVRAYAQQCLSQ